MRLHLGWGGDMTSAARSATRRRATARGAELHGTSNGLRWERHVVELPGDAFVAARAEILAFRWFPRTLIRTAVADDGETVLQRCRIGPISVDAPVRVAERVEEQHRLALTVVTVEGHPERGAERYELVLDPAIDRVTLCVEKAWTLSDPLARLGAPVATWLQAHATRRSLRRFGERRW